MKIKLNKRLLLFATIGLLGTLFSVTLLDLPLTEAQANDTVTITLNITPLSEITVTPFLVDWPAVMPSVQTTEYSLDIKNTGSVNFTKLWSLVDSYALETTNPNGQGQPLLYSAGTFLVLENSSGEAGYRWVNRMEWNDTSKPTGMAGEPANAISWGYYRNLTNIYLWSFNKSVETGTNCANTTGMVFKLKRTAESSTSPDRDLGAADVDSGTAGANTTEWSVWTFGALSPLNNYCVYVSKDCQRTMITQWDFNSSLPTCSNRRYMSEDTLLTDAVETVKITVLVPKGVPSGNTTPSTLTIFAE